ncbi:MAG: Gfo/Idh/MocA family oxidoreductase, partial [Phycisphaerae bacterium]|nr:Gfo/Idh/MocA family oxidoreductase [Phycisphaerae bacterium]
MSEPIDRREFLKRTTTATAALALAPAVSLGEDQAGQRPVRVGLIGAGNRGCSLLRALMGMERVSVPAVCDIDKARIAVAGKIITDAGQNEPEGYADGDEAYKRLLTRDDLDAVIIATPWDLHTPMAAAGMRAGKYVAVEVPASINMAQCWELVRAHEET